MPLSELANINYSYGPAKISRDNTRRRVVIGINVRNRDMQSVVDDVQKIINEKIKLPSGYYIEYGGQFENLKSAKARLSIALPIALILIFILLHFAFGSFKEAAMVYSAIPLAAVGGVYLLWLRGLPFSISAGVGFIALFGIAVLNGIVLIEHFKELKEHGISDITERIIKGTKERLRPVMLTAMAAALGFLPMAISTNAGAEVQRPLATVVIGGLISSTFLTMVVLPVFYSIFDTRTFMLKKRNVKTLIFFVLILSGIQIGNSQKINNLNDLLILAEKNNIEVDISNFEIQKADSEVKSAIQFDNTNLYFSKDYNNFAINDEPLNVVGIEQSFKSLSVYKLQKKIKKNEYQNKVYEKEVIKKKIFQNISELYYQYTYLLENENVYSTLDSLYLIFTDIENKKYKSGESNYLQKITADAKRSQIKIMLDNIANEKYKIIEALKYLSQSDTLEIIPAKMEQLMPETKSYSNSIFRQIDMNNLAKENLNLRLDKKYWLPEINASFFGGTNMGLGKIVPGFHVGVGMPLIYYGKNAMIQAQKIQYQIAENQSRANEKMYNLDFMKLDSDLKQYEKNLYLLKEQKLTLADQILKTASLNYNNGEIDFFDYIQSIENAKDIELNYNEILNKYNQTVIKINYLY